MILYILWLVDAVTISDVFIRAMLECKVLEALFVPCPIPKDPVIY